MPTTGSSAIHPEGIDTAVELEPTLRYDKRADTFTRISNGTVYRDNGKGSFVAASGESRARLEDVRRARRTSGASSTTP